MFSQIIFLIIVLLIISYSPQTSDNPWIASSKTAILLASVVYSFSILLIILQNSLFSKFLRRSRHILLGTANFLLIAFLMLYHFVLTGQRAFPDSAVIISIFSLFLYYLGVYTFFYTAYPSIPAGSRGLVNSASHYAMNQIRLLLPFCFPFLLFSFIVDLITFFPSSSIKEWVLVHHDSPIGTITLLLIILTFLILTLLFFPPLTVKIWKCRDLPQSKIKEQLDQLCTKAKFKHSGMKTWTILNHSYTAAIVGVIPKFRFVMFTKRLLEELSPRSIIAVLAHEIGHSARKHLLIFPVIIMGMVVFSGAFSSLFGKAFDDWFVMHDKLYPSPFWKTLYPLALFVPYATIFLLYFRFVFGYFSRLFERQADLHIYELELPVEDMQLALDELGHITGGTHQIPCWHHHSIQERIDFLESTKNDPRLAAKHHRRVRNNILGYLLFLISGLIFILLPTAHFSKTVSDYINANNYEKYTHQIIETSQLPTKNPDIYQAVYHSIKRWAVYAPKEIVLFSASDTLFLQKNYQQAAILMESAWNNGDKLKNNSELLQEFTLLTKRILRESTGIEKQRLEKAYHHAIHLP